MKKLLVVMFLFAGTFAFAQANFTQLETAVGQNRQRFEQELQRLESLSQTETNERTFQSYEARFQDMEQQIKNLQFRINLAILSADPRGGITSQLDTVRELINRYALLESEYSRWVSTR